MIDTLVFSQEDYIIFETEEYIFSYELLNRLPKYHRGTLALGLFLSNISLNELCNGKSTPSVKLLEDAIELYWNDRLSLNARTLLKQYQELLQTTNDRKR